MFSPRKQRLNSVLTSFRLTTLELLMSDIGTVSINYLIGGKRRPKTTICLSCCRHHENYRLCSLTLTRLVVQKPLENDLTSIIIAVKMQGSKRVLRSNEILVPPCGLLECELDLSFSLQYPHFLKRDGSKLQVMLQRRKKYKNRTMLGYRTLAVGEVNMSQVLQRAVDKELNLYSDLKEQSTVVAQVIMLSLTSQPVDHEDNGTRKHPVSSDVDRSPDIDNDSDDDEAQEFNDQESSSNDELSDSEGMMLVEEGRPRPRKTSRGQIRPVTSRAKFRRNSRSRNVLQRNFKQKIIALLRRFKASEEALDSEADHELVDPDHNPHDIEDLLVDFDDLSDSGPELDTLSVTSTPKPQLRPFFTDRGNLIEMADIPKASPVKSLSEDNYKRPDSDTHAEQADQELDIHSSPSYHDGNARDQRSELFPNQKPSPQHKANAFQRERSFSYRERQKKQHKLEDRRNSTGQVEQVVPCVCSSAVTETSKDTNSPRKVLLDQLSSLGSNSEDRLPDCFLMVNTAEWQGQFLIQKCQDKPLKLISTCTSADTKAVVNFLVTRIQKFCNSNSKSPSPIKIGVAGNDGYINSILRPYVEQFSSKSPDWQHYVRFLVIPFGASSIGKYLANIDSVYSSLFTDNSWKETFEKSENQKLDSQEIYNRISKYMSNANYLLPIAIGEAMVTYKGRKLARSSSVQPMRQDGFYSHHHSTATSDEESTQIFIPFISEVKIGSPDYLNASVDIEESVTCPTLSGSPPSQVAPTEKTKDGHHTPPNSPNVSLMSPSQSFFVPLLSSQQSVPASAALPFLTATTQSSEYMELQVEYWTLASKSETSDKDRINKKESNKCSLKTAFRSLHVYRLPPAPSEMPISAGFCMGVVTKEKKQKIMRIGKKSKDPESKSQVIDGISRLICTSKNHNYTLKVVVDGVEWTGVKFFQLSSQWQTHIKNFPVVIFSYQEPA
ncbi:phosphofurin acidic cluster sorting protein 2 isoform X2 [Octopus bimaculoides]|uniref:phosphofurin acidic cluster sorting protein 2 isoform X2 n=1 Tax=Octopus bimaculoides TaxID=37653 RepID=UPI00071E43F5|nr:phosphofurin acidic cluster sorting protein 2 isoform X2 [Octopus bimaculoides]|eukprot:XP_014784438.1 PREDICTED: phosphofurin acidic cluster sorting protein 2-like isoform X3 [Octopus bimaculoides]